MTERELPRQRRSRWVMLADTSPSGRVLYRCSTCDRVSPLPDRVCPVTGCVEPTLPDPPDPTRGDP